MNRTFDSGIISFIKRNTLPQCILNMIYIAAIYVVINRSTFIYNILTIVFLVCTLYRTLLHNPIHPMCFCNKLGSMASAGHPCRRLIRGLLFLTKNTIFFWFLTLEYWTHKNHAYDKVTNSAGHLQVWRMSIIEINLKCTVIYSFLGNSPASDF